MYLGVLSLNIDLSHLRVKPAVILAEYPATRAPSAIPAMMVGMTRRFLLAGALTLLAACGSRQEAAQSGDEPEKRYNMQGVVKSVDAAGKSANIDAGKIEGWMEAMRMDYPVKPDSELAKLHPGDRIEGTVVVNGFKYYVTDVKVLPKQ